MKIKDIVAFVPKSITPKKRERFIVYIVFLLLMMDGYMKL